MKHAVKHIHFVGVGGAGMSGIAEILHNLGYTVSGSDQTDSADDAPAGAARRARVHRPRCLAHRGRRGGRDLHRGEGRQPRGAGRARRAHPAGAARGDAGRIDAPEAGHRDRRHPRQDHHHLAGDQRAARGRRRSDLRDRRQAEQRRRALAPRRRRLHRGRGRRERRVVPQPQSDPQCGHQHRRRPHGDLRPRHRPLAPGLHRVPAPHAVLRRRRRVRRRPRRAGDRGRHLAPGDPLWPERRRARARRTGAGAAGRTHAFHLPAPQRRRDAAAGHHARTSPVCTTCAMRWPPLRWPPSSSCPTRRW